MFDTLTGAREGGGTARREFGPYRIVRELGRGGMGVVYLAEQAGLGRLVALKVLASHHSASERAIERFEREVRAVARLNDPNIVRIYDVGRVDGVPYFTMEYVEGVTLHDVLAGLRTRRARVELLTGGDLFDSAFAGEAGLDAAAPSLRGSWAHAACHIVARIADALNHVHGQGVIHRDVKPKNILLARDGRVLLFDFGLARVESDAAMTMTGEFVGTPFYVSPEQLDPPPTGIDERADVYSLGVTLYELLTLQVPFDGDSPQQIFKRIAGRAVRQPRRLNPQVPRDLETVCLVAMARERGRRYPSAADFAADLRRFLEWKPVFARPAGPLQRAALWARRKPATATALLLLALLLGVSALVLRQRGVIRTERTALALAAFQAAQLLAQQGRFGAALVELDDAAARGHDPVAVELLRIELLEAGGNERAAVAALAALRGRSDLGAHLPAVKLLAADLGVERLRDPDAGVELAREAHDAGTLGAADASYARALLAADAEPALAALQETLALAPFHRRARESLGPTLLGLGQHAAAVEFAQHLRSLDAGDPYAVLSAAAAHALHGDVAAAAADLERAKELLGAAARAEVLRWSEQLGVLAGAPDGLLRAVLAGHTDLAAESVRILLSVATLAAGFEYALPDGERRRLRFRLPPALARGHAGVVRAVQTRLASEPAAELSGREHESLLALVDESLRVRPDGFRHFLRAVLGFQSRRPEEVIADLEAAAGTPSIVRIQRVALFLLVRARLFALATPRQGTAPDDARAALVASVLRVLAGGPLEPGAFPLLLEAAHAARDPVLGVELVLRWRREQPGAQPAPHLAAWLAEGLRAQDEWLRGRR